MEQMWRSDADISRLVATFADAEAAFQAGAIDDERAQVGSECVNKRGERLPAHAQDGGPGRAAHRHPEPAPRRHVRRLP